MSLRSLDLNLLYVFAILYEERSISRTAGRLKLTQPAVSNALKRLRGSLNDDLFVRTRRGILPTPLSDRIAPEISELFTNLTSLLSGDDRIFNPKTSNYRFKIAITDYSAVLLIPALSQALNSMNSKVAIDLVHLSERIPFTDLDNGSIDLAIGHFAKLPSSLFKKPLYDDTFGGLIRTDHPYAHKKMTLKEYAALDHIFVAPWGQLGGTVDAVLAKHGYKRSVQYMVPSFSLAPEVVCATNGISTLPMRIIKHYSKIYPLKHFDLPLKIDPFTISMVWHKRTHKEAAQKWLRKIVSGIYD